MHLRFFKEHTEAMVTTIQYATISENIWPAEAKKTLLTNLWESHQPAETFQSAGCFDVFKGEKPIFGVEFVNPTC